MKKLKSILLPFLYAVIALLTGYGGSELNRAKPLSAILPQEEIVVEDSITYPIEYGVTPSEFTTYSVVYQVIWAKTISGIPGEDLLTTHEELIFTGKLPPNATFMTKLKKYVAEGRDRPCPTCEIVRTYGQPIIRVFGKIPNETGDKPTTQEPITE